PRAVYKGNACLMLYKARVAFSAGESQVRNTCCRSTARVHKERVRNQHGRLPGNAARSRRSGGRHLVEQIDALRDASFVI
ncbi:jg195, partial [Pararge aegeria aegeria]